MAEQRTSEARWLPGEFACQQCGYDLRGLKVEDRCPECGLGVHRALAGWRAEAPKRSTFEGCFIVFSAVCWAIIGLFVLMVVL